MFSCCLSEKLEGVIEVVLARILVQQYVVTDHVRVFVAVGTAVCCALNDMKQRGYEYSIARTKR